LSETNPANLVIQSKTAFDGINLINRIF